MNKFTLNLLGKGYMRQFLQNMNPVSNRSHSEH